MPESPKEDPLKKVYQDSIIKAPSRTRDLREHGTALLCIDMQYLDAAEGHG
ncbi:MAG: cysteine hydrolase, partial [Akkermansiaceae bacterium]|nr:cysteine hydrolase [Akkermansiaceae bacterium]